MSRLRSATASNRAASADIQRQILARIRSRANAATLALKQAHGVKPDAALEHLAEVRAVYDDIDRLILELAGALILGGMPAARIRAVTGIGTATLTRRVPRALTALRGRHLVRDRSVPLGWREDAS